MDPSTVIAICFMILGIVLLLHHGYKHSYDPPDSLPHMESCETVCYFQLSDIRNHETWILICLTNAFSIGILCPLLLCDCQ
jgi:hypothetical protein